ncbi:hydantoinase/oxoprolinase family protein [Brevibacillus fluminis]|uniref:hydantoinase/oxoprolinase family protein n=1 Tax=Brevibacillus fluminis TaxID=511487 RepID=UPI003F8A3496
MIYRLGISIDKNWASCVLIDAENQIVAHADGSGNIGVADTIVTLLMRLFANEKIMQQEVSHVMIATNDAMSRLHDSEQLSRVAVIRLGQASDSLPPLWGADATLRQELGLWCGRLKGGHEIDGTPSFGGGPSIADTERLLDGIQLEQYRSFAVTGMFSPVNKEQEIRIGSWLHRLAGEHANVTLSYELGGIGFMERENAAILNAALSLHMRTDFEKMRERIRCFGLQAPLFFVQNDGTLLPFDATLRQPLRLYYSDFSGSLLGGLHACGRKDAIVIDVASHEVRIGMLENGFPKEHRQGQRIAGVRLNLPIPDVVTIPWRRGEAVGSRLVELVFHAIQRFQPHYDRLPLIFVGERSQQLVSSFTYPWAEVFVPGMYRTVRAAGACIAPVGGTVDRMYWLEEMSEEEALASAQDEAVSAAIEAGAEPESVQVLSVQNIPLAYVPSKAVRIKAKAIGRLPQADRRIGV